MTPETLARLYARLEAHEKRVRVPYADSLGNLTIAVGHKLDGGAIPLTDKAIDAILEGDVAAKIADCERHLLFWPTLDDVRQAACVEAAFSGSLFASPKAIEALAAHDYAGAARELLDGPWKAQVGHRAEVVAEQIRTGRWA